jgi:tRNA modification GTPase
LDHLKRSAGLGETTETTFLARRRHLDALEKTRDASLDAQSNLKAGRLECVAEDLRQAHQALGEITGQMSSDELLGQIFSNFCIGK